MRSWLLSGVFGAVMFAFGVAFGDTIQMFDGRQLTGTIASFSSDRFQFIPTDSEEQQSLSVEDATSVTFDNDTRSGSENRRLVHPREKAENVGVRLRAGYHKLVVVYAGKAPELQYARNDRQLTVIPSSVFYAPERGKNFQPSPGLDSDGYRQPDSPGNVQQGVTFRHYSGDAPIDIVKLNESSLTFVTSGQNHDVRSGWPETNRDLGIFTTLVNLDQDGEYRFALSGNQKAALYLGATPTEVLAIVKLKNRDAAAATWQVELAAGGRVDGQIDAWTDSVVHVRTLYEHLPVLQIPTEHVIRVSRGLEASGIDAAELEQDMVIAAVTDERNTRVPGSVIGTKDGKLSVTYRNQDRTISLDKVVEIILGGAKFSAPRICYQQLQLSAFCSFPTTLNSVSNTEVNVRTAWGQELTVPRDSSDSLRFIIRNGRVQFLSDIEPVKIQETPFFDRMMHWKNKQSLTGSALMIGKTEYADGIAMHSRTELTYELAGNYDRFMAVIGLDPEFVNLGDAEIQVVGDDQVLIERLRLAGEESIDIDVSIAGVQRLTIRTDFGEGQDVGDRVHWGNARIVRQSNEE